jgi:CRISPR-associated endoribonuclease Cas6
MRFKIEFKLLGEAPFSLPINYQSEFSAWIHKMLHFQSSEFKQWLATKKFLNQVGEYNLFTFSEVMLAPHKQQNEKVIVEGDSASVVISFYAPAEIEPFIHAIFNRQEFKIGDSRLKAAIRVESVQTLPVPDFKEKKKVAFTCLSPILIGQPGQTTDIFISPDQKDFEKVFFKNLMFKYANLIKYASPGQGNGLSDLNDLQFRLIGKPKTRIIKVRTDSPHQKSVKGYSFNFEVRAPVELLAIGYEAGFGDLNNLGFGCCEIIG